jgi:hypothetical protein
MAWFSHEGTLRGKAEWHDKRNKNMIFFISMEINSLSVTMKTFHCRFPLCLRVRTMLFSDIEK